MDIDKLINNLSGIGTFISSIIAVYTLKELIKQRRAMYRPRLFLNEFTLSVKGNPLFNSKNFYYYKLHLLHEAENKNDLTKHSISSQVFFQNIGYGIANKIKYRWDFDYRKALKKLGRLDNNIQFEIKKDKSILLSKNGEFFGNYNFDDLENEIKIDFIKPETLDFNKKPSIIPMIITTIHMDYVLIKNKMNDEICKKFDFEDFKDFPKPKLTISYEDIAGKKYNEVYKFSLTCSNSFFQKDDWTNNTNTDYAFLTFKSL